MWNHNTVLIIRRLRKVFCTAQNYAQTSLKCLLLLTLKRLYLYNLDTTEPC